MSGPAVPSPSNSDAEDAKAILAGIEKAGEHARNVTLVLLGVCGYVLIATFSVALSSKETVKLPLLDIEPKINEFAFMAPFVITFPYLYLLFYMKELRDRIQEYMTLSLATPISRRSLLLYPWIGVFVVARDIDHVESKGLWNQIVEFAGKILVFGVAPITMLILWVRLVVKTGTGSLLFWGLFGVSVVAYNLGWKGHSKRRSIILFAVLAIQLAVTLVTSVGTKEGHSFLTYVSGRFRLLFDNINQHSLVMNIILSVGPASFAIISNLIKLSKNRRNLAVSRIELADSSSSARASTER